MPKLPKIPSVSPPRRKKIRRASNAKKIVRLAGRGVAGGARLLSATARAAIRGAKTGIKRTRKK